LIILSKSLSSSHSFRHGIRENVYCTGVSSFDTTEVQYLDSIAVTSLRSPGGVLEDSLKSVIAYNRSK
jgi:hypothetical protein